MEQETGSSSFSSGRLCDIGSAESLDAHLISFTDDELETEVRFLIQRTTRILDGLSIQSHNALRALTYDIEASERLARRYTCEHRRVLQRAYRLLSGMQSVVVVG